MSLLTKVFGNKEVTIPTWHGVTIDDITDLDSILESLKALCRKPMVRIVFDKDIGPEDYLEAVKAISEVADILAQPVDSSWMKELTLEDYVTRFDQYLLSDLSKYIEYWEAGNEINGDWTGPSPEMKAQLAADLIRSHDKKSILTLYYTSDMLKFCVNDLDSEDKSGRYDVVLVSYYEEDNDDAKINWPHLIDILSVIFESAWLGIGEFGSTKSYEIKAEMIRRYYTMPIKHERFILGGFYWYFKQDCVTVYKDHTVLPVQSKLWHILNQSWERK